MEKHLSFRSTAKVFFAKNCHFREPQKFFPAKTSNFVEPRKFFPAKCKNFATKLKRKSFFRKHFLPLSNSLQIFVLTHLLLILNALTTLLYCFYCWLLTLYRLVSTKWTTHAENFATFSLRFLLWDWPFCEHEALKE